MIRIKTVQARSKTNLYSRMPRLISVNGVAARRHVAEQRPLMPLADFPHDSYFVMKA